MTNLGRLNQMHVRDARLKRLAEKIDALATKDQRLLHHAMEMAVMRRRAAAELYSICADFVMSVNRLLSQSEMALDPPQYTEESFQEQGSNLVQINARGRILQVDFSATPELISTEDFRIPYTLAGSVRFFNQELLDRDLIEEQLLFYTLEKSKKMWRFFDPRSYRSGPFDQEYLVGLMEQLL